MTRTVVSERGDWGSASSIGWGAIFAGAFVAFVSILILNAFGVAIGMSGDPGIGMGTAIWAIIVALVSLFFGGWVMARMTHEESRGEAAIQGTVLWGILFFAILMLGVMGAQIGLNALIGVASAVNIDIPLQSIANAGADLGLSQEQIETLQQRIATASLPGAASAWWSFIGMIVSLAAVIGGAVVGSKQPHKREHRDVRFHGTETPVT